LDGLFGVLSSVYLFDAKSINVKEIRLFKVVKYNTKRWTFCDVLYDFLHWLLFCRLP